MNYLQACTDLNLECPRGLPASSHLTDYHHRTNDLGSWIVCLKAWPPREMTEQYPHRTKAQSSYWKAHHAHCEAKETKDA